MATTEHYQAILDHLLAVHRRAGEMASDEIWNSLDLETQRQVFMLMYRLLPEVEQEKIFKDLQRTVVG